MSKLFCEYCGEEIINEKVEGVRGFYCSEDCRNEMESDLICEECGEYSNTVSYFGGLVDARVCEECANDIVRCTECGDAVWYDNAHQREDRYGDTIFFCSSSCLEDYDLQHSPYIKTYSYKPVAVFFGGEGPKTRYYGVECELDTDDGRPRPKAEIEIHDKFNKYVYMKYDGSLSEGGVEIVSHPMTLKYHKNNMHWKELFDIARNEGLESREGAGFHIHINNYSFKNIAKTQANLIRIFNHFWDDIVDFSGRYDYELDEWAGKPYVSDFYDEDDNIVSCNREEGRYTAVNLQNTHTTEIRVMASVDNFGDFITRLDFVDNAVEIADTMDWSEIENMSFQDIVDWKEIKKEKAEKIEIKVA